ncbi:hypothetical protein Vretimale_18030 [Volvox reticuliferus]|uniref:Uncharacterized protein n=1 Tax=Volvox reticuliferus TaxID=1737510 RepID=A0A8J4GY02_9CHLO|nr:hypothetical protein Vretifemale_19498 [Volvox reticuliferus]GIM15343.1 hypothetical protein Vretimale_18030 [Volvox reticuliferus]
MWELLRSVCLSVRPHPPVPMSISRCITSLGMSETPPLHVTTVPRHHSYRHQGPLLRETYQASGLSRTRSVLTIHNMAFQGHISLQRMGLASRASHVVLPDIMLHHHHHRHQGQQHSQPAGHTSINPSGMYSWSNTTLNLLKVRPSTSRRRGVLTVGRGVREVLSDRSALTEAHALVTTTKPCSSITSQFAELVLCWRAKGEPPPAMSSAFCNLKNGW